MAIGFLFSSSDGRLHSYFYTLDLKGLERYERPLPQMNEYDQLLGIAASAAKVAR